MYYKIKKIKFTYMANYLQNQGRNWHLSWEVEIFDQIESIFRAKESKNLYQINGYHYSI
jgi:hypothetical protein